MTAKREYFHMGQQQHEDERGTMGLSDTINSLKPGDTVPKPPEPVSEAEIMASWKGDLDKPLISIICHTYNHAAFIGDALNGFLMQKTNFPFEIIVHDDASTDGSTGLLYDYQAKYPQIIRLIVQQENQYQKGNKPQQFTFPKAKGIYIAICEGDDYWIDENKCSKQALYLNANPDVAIVYTNSIPFSGSHVINKDFVGARSDLSQNDLKRSPSIFTLTSCFRNVLEHQVESNLVAYGDLFIWSRLGGVGSGAYIQDILPSFYRVHSGGIHSLSSQEQRSSMEFKTFIVMSFFYQRVGDVELEKYFLEKALDCPLSSFGTSARLIRLIRDIPNGVRKVKSILKG
jgi:glycosyltransferase involved in cell wall biosynthesis